MEIDRLLLEAIAEQIGQDRFDLWFGGDVHFALGGNILSVTAATPCQVRWIRSNYSHVVHAVCQRLFNKKFVLEFSVAGAVAADESAADQSTARESAALETTVKTTNRETVPPTNLFQATEEKRPTAERNDPPGLLASRPTSVPIFQPETPESSPVTAADLPTDEFPRKEPPFGGVEVRHDSIHVLAPSATPALAPPSSNRLAPSATPSPLRPESVTPSSGKKLAVKKRTRNVSAGGKTFASYDSFVKGMSNQLACKVTDLAIARPGVISPIFLYGPTSVGKTHLLEGVYGRFRSMATSNKSPLFYTAEQFLSLFIQSVRPGSDENQAFLSRFRNISLLAIDDLHFLEGKEKTQLQLLYLIDRLKREGVQMIFTANRSLSELKGLHEGLLTRLAAGMPCGIESAERETLLGIFRQMADRLGLVVPDEVGRLVVSRYAAHARHLSGALFRLLAEHLATGRTVTIEMADRVLADMLRTSRRSVTLEEIERTVAEIFELKSGSLRGKSRAKEFAEPRMLVMWLARKHTRCALSEIGRFFNRSHSTVISAQKRVDKWLAEEEKNAISDSPSTPAGRLLTESLRRAERILLG